MLFARVHPSTPLHLERFAVPVGSSRNCGTVQVRGPDPFGPVRGTVRRHSCPPPFVLPSYRSRFPRPGVCSRRSPGTGEDGAGRAGLRTGPARPGERSPGGGVAVGAGAGRAFQGPIRATDATAASLPGRRRPAPASVRAGAGAARHGAHNRARSTVDGHRRGGTFRWKAVPRRGSPGTGRLASRCLRRGAGRQPRAGKGTGPGAGKRLRRGARRAAQSTRRARARCPREPPRSRALLERTGGNARAGNTGGAPRERQT